MAVFRSPDNPIIRPQEIKPSRDDFEVIGVFNTGVARLNDEIILLLRVAERPISKNPGVVSTVVFDVVEKDFVIKEFAGDNPENDFSDPRLIITPDQTFLTSISHLRTAKSKDGISFDIDESPSILPENNYETFGLEDPRISLIDRTYYIDYVAVSPFGVTTCLISTKDFSSFNRHGVIFCPDNKDVAIFPERIDGMYYALHRPVSTLFSKHDIWIAKSPDLRCWGEHSRLMAPVKNGWDETKIGGGAVPFRTEQGWLEIYHGADRNNRYCLGAVLLDSQNPSRILARSGEPILTPQSTCEQEGFFGNVVFTCGLLYEDKMLKMYYGAADTYLCYAEISLNEILSSMHL